MKWQSSEMDKYLQSKEYVDTAIVPLIPISWQKEIKSTVAMGEFISIITQELERQFQGRVVLFPAFTYLETENAEERTLRLKRWSEELKLGGMEHIVYATSDGFWKTVEEELGEWLIWLPSIPLEHLSPENRREVIGGQIKQLVPIMTNKWQNR
ncbi:YpiF family protein [Alkalihalophilus pseudofirmus]|uniref:YpiF family protein n=1 Tax=Alkalihalophilus pseudofirmus TaxID=79885 RepID=A0AAJ2NMN2_ALKPS|nr:MULTISPECIES: YpiF family protein [Alkalihalophilus]MDV2884345.1 YpiF family protein [Alkalihalophilus pseudofirmus]MED1601523.1 YpiF family protein [Alkalihalophilus marmarensis]